MKNRIKILLFLLTVSLNVLGQNGYSLVGPSNSIAFDKLSNAVASGTADNSNFSQNWAWNTATVQTGLTMSSNSLTTGTIASITSSNNTLNSTNGLFRVANLGSSTTGVLARLQSNSNAQSGLTLLANSNLGIGTTAPADLLNLQGGALSFNNTTNSIPYVGINYDQVNDGLAFRTNLASAGLNTTPVFLTRGGNLGIGTTAPSAKLNVLGNSVFTETGTAVSGVVINPNNLGFANTALYINPARPASTAYNHILAAANGVNQFLVRGDGNVGIGTSSPNAPLQFANSLVNRKIVLWENTNNDHQFYGFGVQAGTLRQQIDTPGAVFTFNAGTSTTTSNELMRITGTGSVGIGTTAPNSTLQVNGSVANSTLVVTTLPVTLNSTHNKIQLQGTLINNSTLTLPSPVGITGREYEIYINGSSPTTSNVTIATAAGVFGNPVTGTATATMTMASNVAGGVRALKLISDGGNWHVANINYVQGGGSFPTTISTSTTTGTITLANTQYMQLTGVPAGTYDVHYKMTLSNNDATNRIWATGVTINNAAQSYPAASDATVTMLAILASNHPYSVNGYRRVVLPATGTIEVKGQIFGTQTTPPTFAGNNFLTATRVN